MRSAATGLGGNAGSVAEAGGKIYATDIANNLYTVDPTTGAATLIGPTGIPAVIAYPLTNNPDGSLNLYDESLYGIGGKLYATFDEFSLATDGYTINPSPSDPSISPDLYQINPVTGVATLIGPTSPMILSSVYLDGTLYAFQAKFNASNSFFGTGPVLSAETLNLTNGATSFVSNLDPSNSAIFGASPVPPSPEPASLVLVGSGLIALAARLRRRRT